MKYFIGTIVFAVGLALGTVARAAPQLTAAQCTDYPFVRGQGPVTHHSQSSNQLVTSHRLVMRVTIPTTSIQRSKSSCNCIGVIVLTFVPPLLRISTKLTIAESSIAARDTSGPRSTPVLRFLGNRARPSMNIAAAAGKDIGIAALFRIRHLLAQASWSVAIR